MMEPDLRLLLARHGHATANRPWAFLGHTDAPLSREGQTQVQKLAERLAEEVIDAASVSLLRRAQQTTQGVADALALPLTTDERLIEQNFGAWNGLTLSEATERFSGDVAAWPADREGAAPRRERRWRR